MAQPAASQTVVVNHMPVAQISHAYTPSNAPAMLPKTPVTIFWSVIGALTVLTGLFSISGEYGLITGIQGALLGFVSATLFFGFWWRVIDRTGWPAWWCFGVAIPIVNWVLVAYLAFKEWPVHALLKQQRQD
jgi:hypothetical protein